MLDWTGSQNAKLPSVAVLRGMRKWMRAAIALYVDRCVVVVQALVIVERRMRVVERSVGFV